MSAISSNAMHARELTDILFHRLFGIHSLRTGSSGWWICDSHLQRFLDGDMALAFLQLRAVCQDWHDRLLEYLRVFYMKPMRSPPHIVFRAREYRVTTKWPGHYVGRRKVVFTEYRKYATADLKRWPCLVRCAHHETCVEVEWRRRREIARLPPSRFRIAEEELKAMADRDTRVLHAYGENIMGVE